jgi:hypothetical protein
MWGTFVLDAYRWEDRKQMAAAIEDIASPLDTYGFASGAIYCFWRPDSREVLYIGRAVDLPQRFEQHNGMRGSALGSKRELIGEYFDEAELLGFSALVRSSVSQTPVARHMHQVERDFGTPAEPEWDDVTKPPRSPTEREIADAEGTAIHSYQLAYNALPPWNKIKGELSGWGASMQRPDSTEQLMTGAVDSLLQSRRTFSELAEDPTATHFEEVLQLARSLAAAGSILDNRQLSDRDVLISLDQLEDEDSTRTRERIREDGYIVGACSLGVGPGAAQTDVRKAWSEGRPLPHWGDAPPLR